MAVLTGTRVIRTRKRGESEPRHRKATSGMSERVDANDAIVPFTPRVPPHMQPFANASSEPGTRCAPSRVLSSGMLFFPDDGVSYEGEKGQIFEPTSNCAAIGRQ